MSWALCATTPRRNLSHSSIMFKNASKSDSGRRPQVGVDRTKLGPSKENYFQSRNFRLSVGGPTRASCSVYVKSTIISHVWHMLMYLTNPDDIRLHHDEWSILSCERGMSWRISLITKPTPIPLARDGRAKADPGWSWGRFANELRGVCWAPNPNTTTFYTRPQCQP